MQIPNEIQKKLGEAGTEALTGIISTSLAYSAYEDFSGFKTLVLRRISVGSEGIEFVPELFVIIEKAFYYFDQANQTLEKIKGGAEGAYDKLERFYRGNSNILTSFSDELEDMEEMLFERNIPPHLMDLWFDMKTDLARIENYYFRNQIVFLEFMKKNEDFLGSEADHFLDIRDSIAFQNSNLQSMKSRLDSLHHYFKSIKDERLNKTLFLLTIISAIFLPLNLIVGFFGMNTEGLFFTGDPAGTKNVSMILGGVLLATILGFRVFKLIDRFVLRLFLGRYDVYKNLVAKLEKLDRDLSGR